LSAAQGQNSFAGQRVLILRAFVKKTQKTPLHELAIASQRAKDVT